MGSRSGGVRGLGAVATRPDFGSGWNRLTTDPAFLRAHVRALFTQNASGRLIATNVPGGKAAPRFFLGRTTEGNASWYREDLPAEVIAGLSAASSTVPIGMESEHNPQLAAPFVRILEEFDPVQKIWSGPAFRFPDALEPASSATVISSVNAELLRPHLEPWCEDVAQGETLYAVVIGDAAVAVCGSVRHTPVADEAGVEVAAAFRGKGYALPAVRAWAAAIRRAGREPLYSTSWSNTASRALAKKLGLIQFASDLHIA